MKNWLLTKLFAWIGRKLDGHKTRIGGVCLILNGLVGIVGTIYPDQGLPAMTLETAFACIGSGFVALGLGGKLEKQTQAITQAAAVDTTDPAASGQTGSLPQP